jgi:hypothetical protein
MEPLADFLDDETLKSLAHPADLRLGREIIKAGGVEVLEASPSRVVAQVRPPGGQKRTAELFSTEDGLKCRCT